MTPRDGSIPIRIEVLGIEHRHPIATEARARLTRLLESQPFRVTAVEVRFSDENGPKGGDDIRCALMVKLPRRPPVHVTDVTTSPRVALDSTLAKLERSLQRTREAARDKRRYPKKYFIAARGFAPGE